jgi:hypothetical protein
VVDNPQYVKKGEKTMTTKEQMNPKKTARIAGLLFLIVFVLGVFGELFVRQSLIVPGDAAATVNNIMASESLFRLSFVSDLIRQTVLVLLPLVLYKLLKPVNKNIAALMVVFALVSVTIGFINKLNLIAPLLLLNNADYLKAFEADQLYAQVMLFLDLHEHGAFIQMFLSFWLFPLGYLVFKSGFLPRILGILLIIAGFGYLIDSITFFLFPNFGVTISLFTFIGEVLFMLWLLIKGVNVEQWENRALESA